MLEENPQATGIARQNGQDEVTLRMILSKIEQWIFFLKKKWILLSIIGLIGVGIGYAIAFYKKPLYVATLSFALEDDKGGGGFSGAMGIASQFGIELGGSAGGAFNGTNLLELMKSRSVIEKTLLNPVVINNKTTSLAEYYINFNKIRDGWKAGGVTLNVVFPYGSSDNRDSFNLQQDSVLGKIYSAIKSDNLVVSNREKKINILDIVVTSEDELFSKLFAEELASEVSDFYVKTKSKKSKINVDILEHQADSIRKELNSAISGVASANDHAYNLNPALNIKKVSSVSRQIDVQANTVILTELVKNLELAKVTLRKETPLIQIIDKPILPLEKIVVGKKKTALVWGFVSVLIAAIALLTVDFLRKLK